jgi:hypothetical protein
MLIAKPTAATTNDEVPAANIAPAIIEPAPKASEQNKKNIKKLIIKAVIASSFLLFY